MNAPSTLAPRPSRASGAAYAQAAAPAGARPEYGRCVLPVQAKRMLSTSQMRCPLLSCPVPEALPIPVMADLEQARAQRHRVAIEGRVQPGQRSPAVLLRDGLDGPVRGRQVEPPPCPRNPGVCTSSSARLRSGWPGSYGLERRLSSATMGWHAREAASGSTVVDSVAVFVEAQVGVAFQGAAEELPVIVGHAEVACAEVEGYSSDAAVSLLRNPTWKASYARSRRLTSSGLLRTAAARARHGFVQVSSTHR